MQYRPPFPGSHEAIILGCEVLVGKIAQGKRFRLIPEPGAVLLVWLMMIIRVDDRDDSYSCEGRVTPPAGRKSVIPEH